ncbi:hypothetical protein POV92_11645 [Enterobacter roggenkampii]|uniref:hypothetical protein n=1 Tax=Enterobacter roggenkampii TaxID=1812935 RepID=UPI002FF8AEEA
MKQKFIEWFTKNNNGCSPAMEDDRSFVYEMTQHMFEAYQAGVAEGEARCATLAAELRAVEAIHDEAVFITDDHYEQCPPEVQKMIRSLAVLQIPAYQAFLTEVRAQGVERLANAWYAIANETDPGISISDSSRLKYRQRADDAADFANEIRQEAAQ